MENTLGELARACEAIISYGAWLCLPLSPILVRLDGLYGTGAVLTPLLCSGLGVVVRCKEYGLLDLPSVAARLTLPPDLQTTHPESGACRALFDCPDIALSPTGHRVRLLVATHPATSPNKPAIGILRAETVYELFLTTAPQQAFTSADVLDLYLHRGSFETVLADEDKEQDPDRWCSRTACGQEFCQILHQWIWNLRLDFGHRLSPSAMRLTQFAPAEPAACVHVLEPAEPSAPVPAPEEVVYGPPRWAHRSFTKGFAGSDFAPQPDGTLLCPAGHSLTVHERRPERNGSLRLVYGARMRDCRPCPLRDQCQESRTTLKPRQVSAIVWPLAPGPSLPPLPLVAAPLAQVKLPDLLAPFPVLWGDWPRCHLRRNFLGFLRTQTVDLIAGSSSLQEMKETSKDDVQMRAQRAHYRLCWEKRLARNAHLPPTFPLKITIYGLPASFAQYLGIDLVKTA